jgi:hypothetical protein
MSFKLLKGDPIHKFIPTDHYIIKVGPDMYEPFSFNRVRLVYHKHKDPNIEKIHKLKIEEGHYLWNWPNIFE